MMENDIQPISSKEWDKLKASRVMRQKLTSGSFYWFFHFYMESYIEYATAPFQKEMIDKVSDPAITQLAVMAFRGSGKSSILTTAYPIWSIVGEQKKKFIVIVSLNQSLANAHLKNIAKLLDESALLKKDFWPYDFEENEANQSVIRFPKFGAQIIAVGRDQGLRGMRHGSKRPDVIIADDTEDTSNTKYQPSRDANFKWYTSELMTLGDENTKYITIGNMVHPDATILRLKRDMELGLRDGIFLEYPLARDGISLWKARYPDKAALDKLERRIADATIFQREYMLNYVSDGKNIIKREDIKYYDEIPALLKGQHQRIIIGVDPAIADSRNADFTAMAVITVRGIGDKSVYYIHPNIINAHMNITEIHERLDGLNRLYRQPKFYIESTAFQVSVFQAAQQRGLNVEKVEPKEKKEDRLNMIAYRIKQGNILFPRSGAEDVITQMVDYPAVAHDDQMDAITTAIVPYSIENASKKPSTATFVKGRHIVDASLANRRAARRNRDPNGW
jgi:predicted phage terminase large subunit-like protein